MLKVQEEQLWNKLKKKRKRRAGERSVIPGAFLADTQLTNNGMKMESMSDYQPQKFTEIVGN